jgi:carboxymethylenebutenolidase
VLGHYAENDGWASPAAADALAGQLREAGKQVQFHIYAGADHAFFNDTGSAHDPAAAAQSWERTLSFLRDNLA